MTIDLYIYLKFFRNSYGIKENLLNGLEQNGKANKQFLKNFRMLQFSVHVKCMVITITSPSKIENIQIYFQNTKVYIIIIPFFCSYYNSRLRKAVFNRAVMPLYNKGRSTIKYPLYFSDLVSGIMAALDDPASKGMIFDARGIYFLFRFVYIV